MSRLTWKLETRKVSELEPHPNNPRIITKEKIKELKASLDDIGYAQPINLKHDKKTILSGHARYYILNEEDPNQEIDVYVPCRTLTPREERAVILRMNKNIAGSWDFDILANEFELDELVDIGFDADDFDFSDDDNEKEESEKEQEYKLEILFPNETEMTNIYNDMLQKGYMPKIKGLKA